MVKVQHQALQSTRCGTPNIVTPFKSRRPHDFHSIGTDPMVAFSFLAASLASLTDQYLVEHLNPSYK